MKKLCKNKHWNISEDYKILYLLIDRPNYIDRNNNFYWETKESYWHRDYDLSAYIWNNNDISWFINDKFHRTINKPARIWWDGRKEYWTNNICIKIK